MTSRSWAWWAVLLIAAATIFTSLGRLPFIDRDEGEYATVAQEMIRRHDWVIPHVNGRAYYEKPALFFWLMAGSFQVFGENETAGRLPSAAAGLALAALTGWFARRRLGERAGLLAALMTGTSFLVIMLARTALLDMLLTLWTTLCLFLFYEGYRRPKDQGRWWFYGAWVSMSLAFLTKGPVGAVTPLGAVFFLTVFNRDLWTAIKKARFPEGIVLFLLVSGPWYALAFIREGERFWKGFFISQNVTRYTEVLLGHGAPLYFYLPVLAVMCWPWFFFSLPVLWRGLVRTRPSQRAAGGPENVYFFLGVWAVFVFLVFSLAATKQPNYILPAVPPLIILAAAWWDEQLGQEGRGTGWKWLFGATTGIGLILALFLLAANSFIPIALERVRAGINYDSFEYAFAPTAPDLGAGAFMVGLVVAAAAVLALVFIIRERSGRSLAALAVGGLVLIWGVGHLSAPVVLDYLQTPAREIALEIRGQKGPTDWVGAYGLYKPTLWYYTGGRVTRVRTDRKDLLAKFLSNHRRVFMLSRLSLLPVLEAQPDFRLLGRRGGYVYGDNKGRRPGGGEAGS